MPEDIETLTAADVLGEPNHGGESNEPAEVTPPTPPAEPKFDMEGLGRTIADGLKPTLESLKPTAPEKKFTDDELDTMLHRFKFTPEFMAKMDNLETRAQAMQEMREGMMKQAATISQIMLAKELTAMKKEFEARLNPVTEASARQSAEKINSEFSTQYPQLASPKLARLRATAAQEVLDSDNPPKTLPELFKRTAEGMAEVLKESNPQFTLAASAVGAKPNNNKSAPNSSGHGGGGSAGGGRKVSENSAVDILGPVGRR